MLGSQADSLMLNEITFDADIPFSKEEFFYLTCLKPHSLITKHNIIHAYKQLMSKKRFASINIDLFDDGVQKRLHFTLIGAWTLKKVSILGILFGRQKYVALYSPQPGDVFDVVQHEESIKTIKKTLYDQGFFQASVSDEIFYSQKRKSVTVKIRIKRRQVFTINAITFQINDLDKAILQGEKGRAPSFINEIERKFKNQLLHADYEKASIQKQIKKMRSILKKKDFLNSRILLTRKVNPKKHTVDLTVSITLGKRKLLRFSGNTLFSDQEIREDIIGTDEPDWLFSPDIITEQIMHEYYKRGYWKPRITYQALGNSGFHFSIEEQEPIIVQNIEIRDSKTEIPEECSSFFVDLLHEKKYDQQMLEDGINRLAQSYFSIGFWDFKILEQRVTKNSDTDSYTISLIVEKGIQRFWNGFEIEGYRQLESSDFFKKYRPHFKNQWVPFNYNWLQEQRLFLMNYFQKLGYWYVDVEPEFLVLPASKTINNRMRIFVRWKIDMGEQVRFGKIIVRGNTKLPFSRIIKEIKCKEGDLWSRDKIDLTRRKLKRLDIFQSVQIQPDQLAKPSSKKPIILTLTDDDTAEVRLRAGYFLTSKNFLFKRQSTPKLGASLILKNPTNRADKLSLDFDWTKFERKFDVDYALPSPLNFPFMGKIKGYANKYVHPVQIGSSGSAYEAIQNGFLLGISDEYKQNYFWGINVGSEWLRTSRVRGYLKLNSSVIDTTLPFLFIEPSLLIDNLDNRLNPSKGGLGFFSLKFMLPQNKGDITAKLFAEQSFFYPIYKKVIFAAHLRIGHIFKRKFDFVMPIERFYLGGPYSVRGYEKDAVPPLGVTEKDLNGNIINEYTTSDDTKNPIDPLVTKEYTIQGGSSMLNGNIELRIPVYKSFGTVLFQDIGVLSQSGFLGLTDTWFPTSGFGLRYKTPIGALRFDIGWKWKKRIPNDLGYAWYLTIGEAF